MSNTNEQATATQNTTNQCQTTEGVTPEVASSQGVPADGVVPESVTHEDALFTDTSEITQAVTEVEESEEEVLLTDPDDSSKLALLSGADLEDQSEEDLYALMDSDEDIRDSLTLPGGSYIFEVFPVNPKGKGVKFITSVVNGKIVGRKPKNIGFSCHMVYDVKNKAMIDSYVYQRYHFLKKDGSSFERGKTEYKQFCYYAVAAALDIDYDALLREVDGKIVPLKLFNAKAATSDDAPIYLQCTVLEHPAKDGYPASNEIVPSSIKSDYGLYTKLLESNS
jgi:hypothetical protein